MMVLNFAYIGISFKLQERTKRFDMVLEECSRAGTRLWVDENERANMVRMIGFSIRDNDSFSKKMSYKNDDLG